MRGIFAGLYDNSASSLIMAFANKQKLGALFEQSEFSEIFHDQTQKWARSLAALGR